MSEHHQHPPVLRFGVLCGGTRFPKWQAMCLQKLLALENVEPALLIVDDSPGGVGGVIKESQKRLRNFNRMLWYFYNATTRASRAMRWVDMADSFVGVPVIRCKVHLKGKWSQYFHDEDIAEIRKHELDFALRFGFNIIRGEILEVPRYGVWSFHHGDEERYRGSPPGFWEVFKGDPVTGAMLQRLTDRLDSGIVLKKGFYRTVLTSYARSRDRGFLDSTDWPAQVCLDIQHGNTAHVDGAPSKTDAPIYRAPKNPQMLAFGLKIVRNVLLETAKKSLLTERWNVGVVDQPIESFLQGTEKPSVRWLPPPARARFSADPFAVRGDGGLRILYEDFYFSISKGIISAVTVNGDDVSEPEVAFDEPVHLAYPYLIEHDGEVYCIPESHEARRVVLFRAVEFPLRWERVETLIDGFAGVDSTVIRYAGRWWLFATDQEDGPFHKLRLWHAPELTGPWSPHVMQPAKIDVRSSRPAGTPFEYDGSLYRPAQDCSETYGGRVIINRVNTLTPTDFAEEPVAVIDPYRDGPYSDGIHTLSAAAGAVVVDGMRRVFIGRHPSMVVHKLRRVVGFLR